MKSVGGVDNVPVIAWVREVQILVSTKDNDSLISVRLRCHKVEIFLLSIVSVYFSKTTKSKSAKINSSLDDATTLIYL